MQVRVVEVIVQPCYALPTARLPDTNVGNRSTRGLPPRDADPRCEPRRWRAAGRSRGEMRGGWARRASRGGRGMTSRERARRPQHRGGGEQELVVVRGRGSRPRGDSGGAVAVQRRPDRGTVSGVGGAKRREKQVRADAGEYERAICIAGDRGEDSRRRVRVERAALREGRGAVMMNGRAAALRHRRANRQRTTRPSKQVKRGKSGMAPPGRGISARSSASCTRSSAAERPPMSQQGLVRNSTTGCTVRARGAQDD